MPGLYGERNASERMSKEKPEQFEPNSDDLADVGAEWNALSRGSSESKDAAKDIAADAESDAIIAETIRAELKEMLMHFSDKLLLIPETYPERRLLIDVTDALGILLSPKEWRSDLRRMKLASGPLAQALDDVEKRYERLSGKK
jgi:hypothetical protein